MRLAFSGKAMAEASRLRVPPAVRYLLALVAITFATEAFITVALPILLPGNESRAVEFGADLLGLILIQAPLSSWLIVHPLRTRRCATSAAS